MWLALSLPCPPNMSRRGGRTSALGLGHLTQRPPMRHHRCLAPPLAGQGSLQHPHVACVGGSPPALRWLLWPPTVAAPPNCPMLPAATRLGGGECVLDPPRETLLVDLRSEQQCGPPMAPSVGGESEFSQKSHVRPRVRRWEKVNDPPAPPSVFCHAGGNHQRHGPTCHTPGGHSSNWHWQCAITCPLPTWSRG